MDANTRTATSMSARGLLCALFLSVLVTLCTSTPIPTNQPYGHYDILVRHTSSLKRFHRLLYTDFRNIRYDDPAIRLDDFRIIGVPSLDDLPIPLTRLGMEETELLPIHYERMRAFQVVFGQVLNDELALDMASNEDFSGRVADVIILLDRVVSRLKQTMLGLEIAHDYDALPAINFSSNPNRVYLNMRILFGLQELEENLQETLSDFTRLRNAHEVDSS